MPNSARIALCALALFFTLNSNAQAILGGDNSPAYAPNMLMILSDKGSMCSGVVIAPDAVLTAAHCVTNAKNFRLHWRDTQGRPILAEPADIVVHPAYMSNALKGRVVSVDLAIVRARTPVPPQFKPLALASGATDMPSAGSVLSVVGFGLMLEWDPSSTGRLQSIKLPVITPYGQGKVLIWLSGNGNKGACLGDSGGLIADQDGMAVAITAWSEGSASRRCGALTQGVLIAPHRAWIDKAIGH